ncbi:RHS repeat-associated core domain-containing protein, partial [Lysobacter fragariae]
RIADATGAVVNQMDFLAFGARRDFDTQTAGGTPPSLTTRGFTGHETVDGVLGLIHMNGRIFDPGLGRFLQADPVIQAPENAQSWNAYTYVFNNPLTYTDPTGMMSAGNILRIIVAAVIMYFTAGAASLWIYAGASAASIGTGLAIMAAGGFLAGVVTTGTLRGGVYGAFGAMLTGGIMAMGFGAVGNVVAQGFSGGIMESIQGGNFGNGFVAAGLTAAAMPGVGAIDNGVARTMVGAIVGGSISEATGGKFANGAIGGAVQAAMSGPSEVDSESDDGSAYCKGGIGKPTDDRYMLDIPNEAWRDKLFVVEENGVITVKGHLTVSGSGSEFAARDATATWGNASGPYNGTMYRSEITVSAVKSGGDWQIKGWNRREWMKLNSKLCSGIAGAKNDHGSSIMRVPPDRRVWQEPGTAGHEIGHAFGLTHAPAGSGSIMSYDPVRAVTGRDIYNLAETYR